VIFIINNKYLNLINFTINEEGTMVEQESDNVEGTVWNFDDKEQELIFELKVKFINCRDNWNLEDAYWTLLSLISESESAFLDGDKEKVQNDFNKISEFRKDNGGNFIELNNDEMKSEAFLMMNEMYRKICGLLVENGLYFRKKQGYLGL
jgi:hypothetical protein